MVPIRKVKTGFLRSSAVLCWILLPLATWAQSLKRDGVVFDADEARLTTTKGKAERVFLKGNVQVVFQNQYLSCDQAEIDAQTKEMIAEGNVILIGPTSKVQAQKIFLNYSNNTGVMYDAFLQSGQVQFQGEVIRRTGEKTYEAIKGRYTSCLTCPPAWSFSSTSIKAEMGSYNYMWNPILRIAGLPIIWLPYLIVPLKSERQSGFLFPSFQFAQTSGFIISPTFFWAMSRSDDSTWTLRRYDRRGVKLVSEYRYVVTPDSRGFLNAAFLDDKVLEIRRWTTTYGHVHELPNGFTHRLNLNLTSDLLYPRDFPLEMLGQHGLPALENRMSVIKNTESTHFSADASYFTNLLRSNILTNNNESTHRLPELRYSFITTPIGKSKALFDMDVNYLNVARADTSYDDRNPDGTVNVDPFGNAVRDGVYNPNTDLIRTGQRLDIRPRLSYSLKLGEYLDVLPSATYRETAYRFPIEGQPSAERRFLSTRTSVRTRMSAIYGDPTDVESNSYKHEIQPEIVHQTIPWLQSTDHPFFGSRDVEPFFRGGTAINDRDNIQFDYEDRLVNRNLVSFVMNNRLMQKRWIDGKPTYRQVALFRVQQSYDFYEQFRKTDQARQPWSDLSFFTDVRFDHFETNTLVRYYPSQQVSTTAARAALRDDRGNYVAINYSQDFLVTDGTTINTNSRTEDLIGSVGLRTSFLSLDLGTAYSFITYRIPFWSAQVALSPPGKCWNISFNIIKPAEAEPIFGFNFNFLFDGATGTTASEQSQFNGQNPASGPIPPGQEPRRQIPTVPTPRAPLTGGPQA